MPSAHNKINKIKRLMGKPISSSWAESFLNALSLALCAFMVLLLPCCFLIKETPRISAKAYVSRKEFIAKHNEAYFIGKVNSVREVPDRYRACLTIEEPSEEKCYSDSEYLFNKAGSFEIQYTYLTLFGFKLSTQVYFR